MLLINPCFLQLFNLCWYFLLGVGSALDTCKGPTLYTLNDSFASAFKMQRTEVGACGMTAFCCSGQPIVWRWR